MDKPALTEHAVLAIASRAALRALPSFRFPPDESDERYRYSQRVALEALHVCAWSGAAVVIGTMAPSDLHSALERAKKEASPWAKADRVEMICADLAIALLAAFARTARPKARDRSSELIDKLKAAVERSGNAAALDALNADLNDENLQSAEPALLLNARLWPKDSARDWSKEIGEWLAYVAIYDSPELNRALSGMLASPSPDVQWNVALDYLTEWSKRSGPTISSSAAVNAPSVTPEVPVSIDLTKYSLSPWGVQAIVSRAIDRLKHRKMDALGAAALVLEIAEAGQPVADPQWIGDFVRQTVARSEAKYEEALRVYGLSSQNRRPARAAEPPALGTVALRPGMAWVLERAKQLAVETSGSDKICGRHLFAALILDPPPPYELGSQRVLTEIGVHVPLLRQRLYEWVRGYGENDTAWRSALMGAAGPRRRAGFDADSTSGPDLLNIEPDVVALATLIAARDCAPPLSIGLFGDWGSGKTFFMGQLRRTVAQFSQEARDSRVMQRDHPFFKRIVQIEFNAWHYAEGNLWASMVEHILANLKISEDEEESATSRLQEHLIERLKFAETTTKDATEKKDAAANKVTRAVNAVVKAENEHEAKKQKLQELTRKNAARDFRLSGALPVIAKALEPLGLKPMSDAVADLKSSLQQARSVVGRGGVLMTSLIRARDRGTRLRSLLIILFGAPLAVLAMTWLFRVLTQEQVSRTWQAALAVAGFLSGAAKWIHGQATWIAEQEEAIEGAQTVYDKALADELADTAQQMATMEQELALARQDYLLAVQRAEQARREEDAARAELKEATTSRLLGRFIQDRAASSDYRKHLGILAVIRQDFQQLSQLIEEDNWQLAPDDPVEDKKRARKGLQKIKTLAEEERGAETRINRIVLYIDDLDRCKPEKVVEVLQAVHLLLAFPLFVVVVGVDARWVSRSLETRYRELLRVSDDSATNLSEMFGVARSEDYLEKIFQIPLWLQRMDANAARRMVQGMLRGAAVPPSADGRKDATPSSNAGAAKKADAESLPEQRTTENAPKVPVPNAAPAAPAGASQQGVTNPQTNAAAAGASEKRDVAPPPPPAANLESLQIRDFELNTIDTLSPLLGRSPRALKRFVNLYRLIKASLTPTEHDVFIEQPNDRVHEYAAVLFLLAVDTGLPRAGKAVFDILANPDADEMSVKAFVTKLEGHNSAETSDYAALSRWMERERRWFDIDGTIAKLVTWAPRVARHSFQAAHIEEPAPSKRGKPQPH